MSHLPKLDPDKPTGHVFVADGVEFLVDRNKGVQINITDMNFLENLSDVTMHNKKAHTDVQRFGSALIDYMMFRCDGDHRWLHLHNEDEQGEQ
jgi:hypothetical protein